MNNLFRLLIGCGVAACAVVIFAIGVARNNEALLAPFNLLVFAVGILAYFLPTMLALYRNCHATSYIAIVNVLLGWTIVGWFAAIGWAAAGKVDAFPPTITTPPHSPVTGH